MHAAYQSHEQRQSQLTGRTEPLETSIRVNEATNSQPSRRFQNH
jgi:hypothetical protein